MNKQEYLLAMTQLEVNRFNSSKIRAVSAYWKEEVACISFYFNGAITEEDKESASDICTYIIANFPDGLLEENFIRWDYPRPLPERSFAFRKNEK